MSEERVVLKACPFCGLPATISEGEKYRHWVGCQQCGIGASYNLPYPGQTFSSEYPGQAEMVAWNTRTPPPEVRRVCEEILRLLNRANYRQGERTVGTETLRRWLAALEGAFKHE